MTNVVTLSGTELDPGKPNQNIVDAIKMEKLKMLQNGKFVREEPPTLGVNYLPLKHHSVMTEEEEFIQAVLFDDGQHRRSSTSVLMHLLGFFAVCNVAYLILKGF